MLQHQWQDAPFRIASLGDRNPVKDGDEIVILAAPDPQGELHDNDWAESSCYIRKRPYVIVTLMSQQRSLR